MGRLKVERCVKGRGMRVLAGSLSSLLIACSATPAPSRARVTDERAIHEIATGFASAWNRHDMKALSELCAEDADFVVITGRHLKGREEIFTYHDALHKGIFKDRVLSAQLRDVRFIRSDVAVGHLGFEGDDASGDERRKTAAFATIVVAKQDGKWLITAFHNTLLTGPPGGVLPSDRR
jgi:uncharacterized protein (TIGR02246 family)